MEGYLEENLLLLPLNVVTEIMKLLEYISGPIYSFHLIDIAQAITNKWHILL